MTSQREVISTTENSLAAFVTNALPDSINTDLQPHSNSYSEKVSVILMLVALLTDT